MSDLTIKLSGLLAGYSDAPRLQYRTTKQQPTRSAVLGLIRCAMGIKRGQNLERLDSLKVTVSESEPLPIMRDFQTIREAVTYSGEHGRNSITYRDYLINPEFTVTLSGDPDMLGDIEIALKKPIWQLYLGRRNCVPTLPVYPVKDKANFGHCATV